MQSQNKRTNRGSHPDMTLGTVMDSGTELKCFKVRIQRGERETLAPHYSGLCNTKMVHVPRTPPPAASLTRIKLSPLPFLFQSYHPSHTSTQGLAPAVSPLPSKDYLRRHVARTFAACISKWVNLQITCLRPRGLQVFKSTKLELKGVSSSSGEIWWLEKDARVEATLTLSSKGSPLPLL